jgi:hypothetical protein
MRSIAILLAVCSPVSADLLWEIEKGGSGGGPPGSEHPARLTFSTNDIGPFQWLGQVSLADVGQPIDIDAATVGSFEQIVTKPGNVLFSIAILALSGDGGDSQQIETSISENQQYAFNTIRHAPLLVTNLFGYHLTGITFTLDSLTYEPIGFTGEYLSMGRGTFRFYGERTPSLPGDFNISGEVDAADYVLWRNLRGQAMQLPNESGIVTSSVDIEDYWYWTANFGELAPPSAKTAPEPGGIWVLLLAGLGGLLCGRHRKIQRR